MFFYLIWFKSIICFDLLIIELVWFFRFDVEIGIVVDKLEVEICVLVVIDSEVLKLNWSIPNWNYFCKSK